MSDEPEARRVGTRCPHERDLVAGSVGRRMAGRRCRDPIAPGALRVEVITRSADPSGSPDR
jgi:hypothetical protein